jgi:hypothetical protein
MRNIITENREYSSLEHGFTDAVIKLRQVCVLCYHAALFHNVVRILVKHKTLKKSALGEQNVMGQIISSCFLFCFKLCISFFFPCFMGHVK